MTAFHAVLGIVTVLALGWAGFRGVALRKDDESQQAVAAVGAGALALQCITGFMLFDASVSGPGIVHYALPVIALVAVLGARAVRRPNRTRVVAAASLGAAVLAVVAYVTGIAAA
jgi:heme A synthase